MAADYLAIQGSATPVERVWSSAAETDTKRRNRLSPARFEALQFLKAVYRRRRVLKLTAEEKERIRQHRIEAVKRDLLDIVGDLEDLDLSDAAKEPDSE